MKTPWEKAVDKGQGRYEAAMKLHYADVAAGLCRKCKREYGTPAKLRMHYQSDAHRKRAAKPAKK